jgi:hypothetical protein
MLGTPLARMSFTAAQNPTKKKKKKQQKCRSMTKNGMVALLLPKSSHVSVELAFIASKMIFVPSVPNPFPLCGSVKKRKMRRKTMKSLLHKSRCVRDLFTRRHSAMCSAPVASVRLPSKEKLRKKKKKMKQNASYLEIPIVSRSCCASVHQISSQCLCTKYLDIKKEERVKISAMEIVVQT